MKMQLKTSLLTLSIAAALSACGGGSSGGTLPGSTTQTPITSSGTISGFGSVIVNGVRYETTAARIVSEDDGNTLVQNPTDDQVRNFLGEGNVVKVQGTKSDDSNGVATTITVDDELVGDIASINVATGTFVVMGQTVSVSPTTVIDNSIIEEFRNTDNEVDTQLGSLPENIGQLLIVGMTVQISGLPSTNGIEATRIEDVAAAGGTTGGNGGNNTLGESEVKGAVSNHNPTADTFSINGLNVNYASAVFDAGFTNNEPADGQFVEVHGSFDGTDLNATRIELEDNGFDDSPENEVEVEGIITDVDTTNNQITINSQTIDVDDASQFSVGMHIEIKLVNQQVVRVQNEAEDTVRIDDEVTSVDTLARTATTRLGMVIELTNRSRLEDDTDTLVDNPSIDDFLGEVNGKYIEARGFPMNNGIVWTRAEISGQPESDCRLRGPVSAKNDTTFELTIEGITIDASSSQFEDANDAPIANAATFFGLLTVGDIVEAQSTRSGGCNGGMTAREVSFEPEDDVLLSTGGGSTVGANGNELVGTISSIQADSFIIAGETVSVTDSTVIDDSIVEDARGVELTVESFLRSELSETLDALLASNTTYKVTVDRSSGSAVATEIEDF